MEIIHPMTSVVPENHNKLTKQYKKTASARLNTGTNFSIFNIFHSVSLCNHKAATEKGTYTTYGTLHQA